MDDILINYKMLNQLDHTQMIKLPFIDIMNPWRLTATLNIKPMNVTLDKGLFRALCIRNITGDMALDTIVAYGVGYSLRRFTV